jgi:hypothetical protein
MMTRRLSDKGEIVTAIGKTYVATLSSDMRGPLERKPAKSWQDAFIRARLLLDAAEKRDWWKGERVSISISQSEE